MSSRISQSTSRGGSSAGSMTSGSNQERRRSLLSKAVDKAKAKLSRSQSGAEILPDDEEAFEKAREREVKREKRKEEFEKSGLKEQPMFGMKGAGGFGSL
ncbi:hypothetical protein B0A48_08857 [Cryoendolithus antarcticus]|uniref:Uncharacterized protein n=1 Tax=Cryoendolithus antarcticus TaxID=1507870 RepID=A0A1V8T4N4_9PEZI|nr:hypothetical protein B0A48_08857 [Cryoendolithus antarcticus]